MSPRSSRRRFVSTVAATVASVSLAGCSSKDIYVPSNKDGQPDIQIENCQSESVTVAVTVTYKETGEVVYDDSHSVPGDYCSDVGPSYYLEEVWTEPGEYLVRAEVSDIGTEEATVKLSESAVENDTATRAIRVDNREIDISGDES